MMTLGMRSFLIVLSLLFFSTSAVAATAANTEDGKAGDPLELTDLTIPVSAGVVAYYEDDGSDPVRWYGIAASHVDGTRAFGTAQNSTNIYYNETDTTATAVTFPASADADSDDKWVGANNWER